LLLFFKKEDLPLPAFLRSPIEVASRHREGKMPHGQFCWYELMTSDPVAAAEFYKRVIGWESEAAGVPGVDYTIVKMGQVGVGGIMTIPEEAARMGAVPCWLGYIYVEDVDAASVRLIEAGGKVKRPAWDIPGVGRAAVVADPHGAVFVLFKDSSGATPPPVPHNAPGHVSWHELHAGEREAAFAFYAGQFGWTKTSTFPMGPMGLYQLFATGELPNGGMLTKLPDVPMPGWLFYFMVTGMDAAIARVTEAGGKIINGPHQVPGESWIVQGLDPQGAMFALNAAAR